MASLDLVRKLAAHGADVNARQTKEPRDGNGNAMDRRGATPFLLATKALDLPLMQTLLELGADPKLTTDEGTTAVMVAAGVGQGSTPRARARARSRRRSSRSSSRCRVGGGTVNDQNVANETALHGAMYRGGSIAMIDFLVERGASPEGVINKRGWTPLRIADGIALDGVAFIRYPETAAHVRELLRARGLPIPPVQSDAPSAATAQNAATAQD